MQMRCAHSRYARIAFVWARLNAYLCVCAHLARHSREDDEMTQEISNSEAVIDWERAAEELRMDYTAVDFDGVTYWVR